MGDLKTDDSTSFQNALDFCDIVQIPSGDFLINKTLNMRINTTLKGVSSKKTRILVGENLTDEYVIKYGTTSTYDSKKGIIQDFNIISSGKNKSLGVYIYGALKIINMMFFNLKCAIYKHPAYLDEIQIINTAVDYCLGTSDKLGLRWTSEDWYIDILGLPNLSSYFDFNQSLL